MGGRAPEPTKTASVPVPLTAVVLLLFVSAALRFRGVFLDPTFWGEDGTFFFRQSIEDGPSAILWPVYGTHLLLPRLVAFLVSFLPTFWAPLSYAVAAGVLSSLSLSLFSQAGYRWLVADDRVRVLMCWLFSLVPGSYECFLALTPGTYLVFCGVLLLLLDRDAEGRWRMGLGRAVLISFLWFSLGQSLVLAPLVAYLFWLTRNRNYLLLLATLSGSVLWNLGADNDEYRPDPLRSPARLVAIYFENLAVRLGFVPLVPQRWHALVLKMDSPSFLVLSAALIGSYSWAAFKARRRDSEGLRVLVLAVLCVMATFPLTALARRYGVALFSRTEMALGGRHALVPAVIALLLMWQLLARPGWKGARRVAATGLLAWSTFCVLYEPLSQPPGAPVAPSWQWPQQAATIDAALRARRAGTLQEPVVLSRINCRPALPPGVWKIRRLTIAPREKPTPAGRTGRASEICLPRA